MAEKKENQTSFACGFYLPCETRHVVKIESGGSDAPHNLVPLCKSCHYFVTHGLAELPNFSLIFKWLLGEDSKIRREQRLFTLSFIQLMVDWAVCPEQAHEICKELMRTWLNLEVASFKQGYHPDYDAPYGYKRVGRKLLPVSSELAIVTKIRELRKKFVTNEKILEALTKLPK
ncbi:MAG: HNH endonuclease [Deltaproteobacteria bacterium]|nr:HNH endonuclease [Deltaproteobacteria bacterium]